MSPATTSTIYAIVWNKVAKYLPRSERMYGPFISLKTGRPFANERIIAGWRKAAKALKQDCSFSGHSGRRSAITAMIDYGMDTEEINETMGYRPGSSMPSHYDTRTKAQRKLRKPRESKNKETPRTKAEYWSTL